MWRTAVRMMLFFLAFTLNVTVRAEILDEPVGCHEKSEIPCSYFVQGHHEVLQWGSDKVRLSKGTSFVRATADDYRLVNGEALVESERELTVGSVYGKVQLNNGRALVKVNNKKLSFFSLSGVVKYQPRGLKSYTFLPVGFNNFISRVKTDGVAASGYPKPAELDELLPVWASFFTRGEKDILENQMTDYRQPWRVAVEMAGPW